jgi:hypothetical protein
VIRFTRQDERINNVSRRQQGNRSKARGKIWLDVGKEKKIWMGIADSNKAKYKGIVNL